MSLGITDMLRLAGQMGKIKEQMAAAQERAARRTVHAEVGGGMVKVTAVATGEIVDVQIDPEALKDPETIGPLVAAGTNLALKKAREAMQEEMKTALGGIDLPPGLLGTM